MSNNKTIFPNVLKNEKIFRELLKALTGSDPGHLEHLLLCGRDEQACEINLSVDYSVFATTSISFDVISSGAA